IARIDELWPPAMSPGGRRWIIDNVGDGILDEATAKLTLDLDPVAHTAAISSAQGGLRYRDLTVNYFNGLPLARGVAGTARFTGKRLEFTPTAGLVKGVKLTGGTVQLSELGERVEWLTIDLAAT